MRNCKVYNIYTHSSPEIPIDHMLVSITYMAIHFFEISDGVVSARGNISIMDYIEGCGGDDPWEATGILQDNILRWTVRRKTPVDNDFCFCATDGEPLFTLSEFVNVAIKKFIATKLQYVTECLWQNPSATKIVDRVSVG